MKSRTFLLLKFFTCNASDVLMFTHFQLKIPLALVTLLLQILTGLSIQLFSPLGEVLSAVLAPSSV
jgi:hypothetical protein